MSKAEAAKAVGKGGLTLVNYLADLARSAPEAQSTIRRVVGGITQNVPENILPIDLIASGRLTPDSLGALLRARQEAGSNFVDYAKTVHNLARKSPEELTAIAQSGRKFGRQADLVPDDYVPGPREWSLVRQGEVPAVSDAIREMSVRSMLARGYDPDKPLTVFRDYDFMDDPGYVSGALSVSPNPGAMQSDRFISFYARPRDVLTDYRIQTNEIGGEQELQFLRENLDRITALNSYEQAMELVRRGLA